MSLKYPPRRGPRVPTAAPGIRYRPALATAASAGMMALHAAWAASPSALDLGKPPTPPTPAQPPGAPNPAFSTPLYLEVTLNGQPTQTVAPFYLKDGRLFADVEDLKQIGLKTEELKDLPELKRIRLDRASAGEAGLLPLDQVPGLQYRYDAARQSIDLTVTNQLIEPNLIGARSGHPPAAAADTGLVLNYDAFLEGGHRTETSFSMLNEARLFNPLGIFDNTGVIRAGGALDPYTRLDSAWHYDDPQALTTAQAGDAISSSLSWSRSVRMGGFQFRRNFSLRPDLITFPVPTLSGSAAVPSAVDLYINNVRQFSSEVPTGPFVINNPVALTGAGQAQLVVRDALGRQVSTTVPIYIDNRMVASGLSSYSFEGGFLRRNYGLKSFDYGETPSFNYTYRYGWSDAFTFEGHGEATAGLYNAGEGALLRLGQWGVVNAAVAGSVGTSAGNQASLGYQLILPHISFVAQTTRTLHEYRDLATIGGAPPPRIFDQVNLSMPILRTQSIGVSYIHTENPLLPVPLSTPTVNQPGAPILITNTTTVNNNPVSRIASFSYTAQVISWCSLFGNAYRDFDSSHGYGFWLGLSINFGSRVVGFVNGGRSSGQTNYGGNVVKSADYNGGWEWGLQDNEGSSNYTRLARAGYLGRYGEFTGSAQKAGDQTLLSLEGNGGLVFMDRVFEPSRHIYDSFALVSTDGVTGIPVLNENRVMGNTDRSGHLLIPDLNSYQHNHLEIDSLVLPADASIPVNKLDITPRSQAGVLVHFAIRHYTAATVILVDRSGAPLPSGTLVRDTESGQDFVVGYDGQAFIEDLQAHNHLAARNNGPGAHLSCSAEFDYHPPANSNTLPTIGPVVCAPK
ncbi:MAG: fimbria/pilus outer membrane usher protein [Nevskia sp.]|nr:fimbria/pilus outer membrane usher protein [Nevskia sp.]